ncbi:MAG: ferredoxin:glutaredoxin reductase [Candidatus Saganbacteria bacterium]|nr:ferredoxin:glutaredoxin reductase [Candidatus Saganbacteria bacterium]
MNDDDKKIERLFAKLQKERKESGYFLNPDEGFTKDLLAGLIKNEERYGYQSCPCRLASGDRQRDLDIICPCDYRDPDINEYGACFCGLYVSKKVFDGEQKLRSIPERRKYVKETATQKESKPVNISGLSYPVWRCKVCGYLCARDEAPDICPVCKVPKERFERFI